MTDVLSPQSTSSLKNESVLLHVCRKMIYVQGMFTILSYFLKSFFGHRVTSYRSICLYVSTDKPAINTTKLPKKIPVFRGYPEELVCEADGHPRPNIQWIYSPYKVPPLSNDTLTVSEAGLYNCTATNEVDSTFYVVEVILKGNN